MHIFLQLKVWNYFDVPLCAIKYITDIRFLQLQHALIIRYLNFSVFTNIDISYLFIIIYE
jgi:hypothetical protein